MIKLDGTKIAADIQADLTVQVDQLREQGIVPGLAVIIVGEDPASKVYVGRKEKMAETMGIRSVRYALPATATEKEVLTLIEKLNQDPVIDGILIQLPLPEQIREQKVLHAVDPKKEVDCFHPENIGKMLLGQDGLLPCTPHGIIRLLKAYNIPISGKNAVIIGRSNIVGKPLAQLLINENATVTLAHSRSRHLNYFTRNADMLFVAIGRPNYIKAHMVKKDAVVVDVGINRLEGKLVGDVDYESVSRIAGYLTPVPGGVGPMTIIMLMYNTIKACQTRRNDEDGRTDRQ